MKQIYDCNQITLSHAQMVELRNEGKLNLGINDDLSARLANEKGLGPTKTTANIAFHFWNWIAFGGFLYTVYLSFTGSWWWFLLGIFGAIAIYRANKKGNSENYLDAVMIDEEFYERIRNINGWMYQLEEETYQKEKQDEATLKS
jgi:hypothetical protein